MRKILEKVDFVNRYQKICEKYNDYENSMSGSDKKKYLEILNSINDEVSYSSKDRTFKYSFKYKNCILDMILTMHNGMVETHLNYLKDDKWLMFNRFDGYAQELNPDFNREIHNIPKYSSFKELENILREIFGIYEDIKKELKRLNGDI
ncbi:hypothetical protein [Winogradskyella sp.]|uniref:hypothetical protein n=1 Tax=Winogradskyella sp. TaxID=1883156 RepID=UPI002608D625|nr:hypothetical protein [Winogradskyella sp.]